MSKPSPSEIKTAWVYYEHADNLQHQRHNIFMLAQSIFFAAFTQAPGPLRYIMIAFGGLYSLLWWYLAERLTHGMNALNDGYLDHDDIYKAYCRGLLRHKFVVTGRIVLNWVLPLATLTAWVILLCLTLKGRLPASATPTS